MTGKFQWQVPPENKRIGTIFVGGKGKHAHVMGLVALKRANAYRFDVYQRSQQHGFARIGLGDSRGFLLRDSARMLESARAEKRALLAKKNERLPSVKPGMSKLEKARTRRERRRLRKLYASWARVLIGGAAVMYMVAFKGLRGG